MGGIKVQRAWDHFDPTKTDHKFPVDDTVMNCLYPGEFSAFCVSPDLVTLTVSLERASVEHSWPEVSDFELGGR